jgi:hypothetical protein
MKARIKKTGEIINVAEYAKVVLDSCDSYGDPLELGFDEVEILQDKSDNIDWEQRMFEIAKDIYSRNYGNSKVAAKTCAKIAIERANILISELKKGDKNANY